MAKLRYLPPNVVTLLSLTLGLVSIHHAMRGDLVEASWFILYSVLLDKLDGTLARLLGAQSRMGVELDSFADFIAFGLAPAFLLACFRGPGEEIPPIRADLVPALIYVVGCVLRLARYNVIDSDTFPGLFRGVPSTLSGGLVGSAVLVAIQYGMPTATIRPALGLVLGLLGLLMVGPIYLPKIGTARSPFWKGMTVLNLILAYSFVIVRAFPEYLLALPISYLIAGSFVGARHARELKESQAAAAEDLPPADPDPEAD